MRLFLKWNILFLALSYNITNRKEHFITYQVTQKNKIAVIVDVIKSDNVNTFLFTVL